MKQLGTMISQVCFEITFNLMFCLLNFRKGKNSSRSKKKVMSKKSRLRSAILMRLLPQDFSNLYHDSILKICTKSAVPEPLYIYIYTHAHQPEFLKILIGFGSFSFSCCIFKSTPSLFIYAIYAMFVLIVIVIFAR